MNALVHGGLRALGAALSGPDKLLVLIYHRVLAAPDPLLEGVVDTQTFDWHLRVLRGNFNVMSLRTAVAALRNRALPRRALAITFDDGYADNYLAALPLLQKHGLPATFFIATDYLDGGCMFNDLVFEAARVAAGDELDLTRLGLGRYPLTAPADRRSAAEQIIGELKYLAMDERHARALEVLESAGGTVPADLMMTSQQLRGLAAAGMEIGAHTHRHPILASLDAAAARADIAAGRARLAEILGNDVGLFAYPNGGPERDYRSADVASVRELGFDAAVSTAWGCATTGGDDFQVPRVAPWDQTPTRFLARLVRAYTQTRVHAVPSVGPA